MAQVTQRHLQRLGIPQNLRYHLAQRSFGEWVADGHRVGHHFQPPHAGGQLIQKISARAAVAHHRRRAYARQMLELGDLFRRGGRVGGVVELLGRVHLAQSLSVADVKGIEHGILRVAIELLPAPHPPEHLAGDEQAQGLGRRVGQVQVVGLILGVGKRNGHGVVGELRGPLKTRRAEAAGHKRVHHRLNYVGRFELVGDFGFVGKARVSPVRNGVLVDVGQKIAAQRVAAHQPLGVPLEGDAIHLGIQHGLVGLEIFGDVVEHRLAAARGPDGPGHAVGKARYLRPGLVVFRLIAHLEGDDGGVFAIEQLGIRVAVVEKLRQVALLGRDGARVGVGLRLGINAGKARTRVFFRVAVVPVGDGREDDFDAALPQFIYQKIEQAQVVVFLQIAHRIGDFHVPDVYPKCIDSQPGQVVHILPDGLLVRHAQPLVRPVGVGKRRGVVHPEQGHFLVAFFPAQHAFFIDEDVAVGLVASRLGSDREYAGLNDKGQN